MLLELIHSSVTKPHSQKGCLQRWSQILTLISLDVDNKGPITMHGLLWPMPGTLH